MSDNTNLKIGQKYGIWTIIEDIGKLNKWREKFSENKDNTKRTVF